MRKSTVCTVLSARREVESEHLAIQAMPNHSHLQTGHRPKRRALASDPLRTPRIRSPVVPTATLKSSSLIARQVSEAGRLLLMQTCRVGSIRSAGIQLTTVPAQMSCPLAPDQLTLCERMSQTRTLPSSPQLMRDVASENERPLTAPACMAGSIACCTAPAPSTSIRAMALPEDAAMTARPP